MASNDLVKQIRDFCQSKGDPAMVKKYSRFFKEGYDAYGLTDKDYDECTALVFGGKEFP